MRWLYGPPSNYMLDWMNKFVRIAMMVAALVVIWQGQIPGLPDGSARANEHEDSVESGKRALHGRVRFPWYDPAEDSLRRIRVKEDQTDRSQRKTDWELGQVNAPQWTFWRYIGEALRIGVYVLLLALVVTLVVLLVRAFIAREERVAGVAGEADETDYRDGDVDRVDNLPFAIQRPRGDLMLEARRLYEQGDYAGAIIYLFSYQLVQLDRHQFIHLTRGKTNRQYVREIRRWPSLRGLLEQTMVTFEDVFFGHHPLDRRGFEACWNRLDDFHQQLQQVPT